MRLIFASLSFAFLFGINGNAQEKTMQEQEHQHHDDQPLPRRQTNEAQHEHTQDSPATTSHMHMTGPLGISMTREGSGTSWQPDNTPMSMIMLNVDDWHFMFHGNAFLGLDLQTSKRGDNLIFSSNWIMASIMHTLGSGQISSRLMLSLEPLTIPGRGYPLLYQSGESYQDQHLHDRQHPHDFFMELALKYALPITDDLGLEFYGAAAGEPAIGPTAFPHRISARSNPFAPIGHHWYDSTHITFGVLTAGIFGTDWKLEASWFNGREPDDNRWNFDFRVPDSFSTRLTYNPIAALSMQASYAYLKSPEADEPEIAVHRLTTSLATDSALWEDSNLASTLMLGVNIPSSGTTTLFGLAEMDLALTEQHTVFGRFEVGSKTGADLVLDSSLSATSFALGALSLGYSFSFPKLWELTPAIGGLLTFNLADSKLDPYYGGPFQMGGMLFVQLRT